MNELSNYLGVSNNQSSNQNNDDTTYIKDIPTTNGNPISNTMYASLPSNYANQYYNQFVSAANKGYGSGLGSDNTYDSAISMPKNELIEKLNYIIDLLEKGVAMSFDEIYGQLSVKEKLSEREVKETIWKLLEEQKKSILLNILQ